MSYYRSNHEVIKILNDNMRTRAFTQSIQKYILDLLNGIRIENLDNLKIEMDMDDIRFIAEFKSESAQKNRISIKSNCIDQEHFQYVSTHMDEFEEIHLRLFYSGSFLYFYPYGIDRISALLNEWLKEYVIYKCSETIDGTDSLYVFENRNGQLVQGLIAPENIEIVQSITVWKLEYFGFWYEFDHALNTAEYLELLELSDELFSKFVLISDYGRVHKRKEQVEISDLHIEQPSSWNTNKILEQKVFYKLSEIEDLFNILMKIHKIVKSKVDVVKPEVIFKPEVYDNEFQQIMISYDEGGELRLGAYSTESSVVVSYRNRDNDLLKQIEELTSVLLPIESIDFLD